MGVFIIKIIWYVLVKEVCFFFVFGLIIVMIGLIGVIVMVGFVGVGGLGDLVYCFGYLCYEFEVMYVIVFILIIFV